MFIEINLIKFPRGLHLPPKHPKETFTFHGVADFACAVAVSTSSKPSRTTGEVRREVRSASRASMNLLFKH
jgi:hypothetical protein